jgi:hypothetical protein
MNNKLNYKVIFFFVPLAILLILYMFTAGIMGENSKIIGQSTDFVKALLENNCSSAFDMLSKEYQIEFFNEPLIFKYAILSFKDFSSVADADKKEKSEDHSVVSARGLGQMVNIDTKIKKSFYIKREFPFFPWKRDVTLSTSFAIPTESPNRFIQFFVQLISLFPDQLFEQFNNHKIILIKEDSFWKISEVRINKKKVDNIFLRDDFFIFSKELSDKYFELEDLLVIAEKLEQNNVDDINIKAFYEIILNKSSKMKNYIEFIENKRFYLEK